MGFPLSFGGARGPAPGNQLLKPRHCTCFWGCWGRLTQSVSLFLTFPFWEVRVSTVVDGATLSEVSSSHNNVASYSCSPQRRLLQRASHVFGGCTGQLSYPRCCWCWLKEKLFTGKVERIVLNVQMFKKIGTCGRGREYNLGLSTARNGMGLGTQLSGSWVRCSALTYKSWVWWCTLVSQCWGGQDRVISGVCWPKWCVPVPVRDPISKNKVNGP